MSVCPQCGTLIRPDGRGRPPRFCCAACRRQWWAGHEEFRALRSRDCAGCGTAFKTRRTEQAYCTLECANRAAARAEAERRAATPLATVWSCGGGVQSTAIAALIVRGDLPKPDFAVMVDVRREKASTWQHVNTVLRPALERVGVSLTILTTPDISVYSGDCLLIPAFRRTGEGGGIRFRTFCSATWKQKTTERWLRAQGVEQFIAWVGISADEAHRIRGSQNRWAQVRYPLVERCMDKTDCLQLATSMGWPQPPRTSCWMCPGMANAEWLNLRESWPEDWAQAVAFERELRQRDPDVYLHKQMVPLPQVRLGDESQMKLFMGACGGECVECRV